MSFKDGENSDLTFENMEQEEKVNIEETFINLGYVKKEPEETEPEFQENEYKIASNFENIFRDSTEQKNNGDSLIGFLDGDAIMKTARVKLENIKEESKDLIQETIEQSKLEIIQCHCCKVLFKQWEHLENHMLHCTDEKYNRLYDNKLDIQQKPAYKIEETQGNSEISTEIDDKRSCLTVTETMDSMYADGVSKSCEEGSLSEKKYKCSECSYESSHKSCLKSHILNRDSNTNETKYKCTHCSYQTNVKSSLNRHINVHNNIKPFECDVCKKKFTLKEYLKKHIMNLHTKITEKKYKCSKCSYQTNGKRKLELHLNTHYNIKPFECNICKKKYSQKQYLKVHIRNQHSNINEKKYKCAECTFQTNYKGHLKTHLDIHNNIRPFECDICKKRFINKNRLKSHIEDKHSNSNEKKYKCTECPYQTNDKYRLKRHLDIHNNTKPFECDICKKKYSGKDYLRVHMRNQHSNTCEKKYKCTESSSQTNDEHILKGHLNNNTRPFECDICKKRFFNKSHLKWHIEDKHSNSNEKKYKCTECVFQTNINSNLKTHLSIHSDNKPFECDVCKKKFTRKSYLKTHTEDKHSNSNEKKYKCTECSYQANRKYNLKQHLNIHNNIQPFECDICKKKFSHKFRLKSHILNIHLSINK